MARGDMTPTGNEEPRRGLRCDPCRGCGRCLAVDDADAVSAATNWAEAFKALDRGTAGPPPPAPGRPGIRPDADATTGATPGVGAACRDLGLDCLDTVLSERGIKPPGMA